MKNVQHVHQESKLNNSQLISHMLSFTWEHRVVYTIGAQQQRMLDTCCWREQTCEYFPCIEYFPIVLATCFLFFLNHRNYQVKFDFQLEFEL